MSSRYWRECAAAMGRMAVIVAERERMKDPDPPDEPYSDACYAVYVSKSNMRTRLAVLVAEIDRIVADPDSLPHEIGLVLDEYDGKTE